MVSALGILVHALMAAPAGGGATAPCPDARAFANDLRSLLGPERGLVPARVDATRHADRFRVTIVVDIDGVPRTRVLQGYDCVALYRAAVLVVASAVDAIAVAQRIAEPRPRPPSGATATPSTGVTQGSAAPPGENAAGPITDEAAPEVGRDARPAAGGKPRILALVRAELGYGTGTTIRGTAIFGAAVGFEVGRARLELNGRYWLARGFPGADRRWFTQQMGTLGLLTYGSVGGGRVWAPMGVGVEAGVVQASGNSVPHARVIRLPWVAAVGRAGLNVRLSAKVALMAAVELAVPLTRIRIEAGPMRRFAFADLSGRVIVGFEGRFGP